MKNVLPSIFALAAVVALSAAPTGTALAADEADAAAAQASELKEATKVDPGAPVVLVNGTPISRAEYDRALNAYMRNFQRMSSGMHGGVGAPNDQMKSEVVEQLIDRELLYQESKKFEVEGAQARVDQEFEAIRARFPSPEVFQEKLASEGLDEDTLRGLLAQQVAVRNYVETEIQPTIQVSDEEVARFFEENREKFTSPEQVQCSHILIRVQPGAGEEERSAAREKAEELQVRCASGEDFAELAREFSEDPGSAEAGGDLGFFGREQMVKPFADAAFALGPGEVSDVVETQFGYHVIKLTDRRLAQEAKLEDVKENISRFLFARALDAAVQSKVQALKDDAKIDVVGAHL